jgi:hypothetical protein
MEIGQRRFRRVSNVPAQVEQTVAATGYYGRQVVVIVVPAQPAATEWKLTWSDEFDGKEIDRAKWDFDLGNGFFNWLALRRAVINDVMEIAEHFFGGGTHYERPLMHALSIVEDYGVRRLPKPDVVFITDDEYRALNEDGEFMRRWKAAKENLDMRCFGIAMAAKSSGALEQISDQVRTLQDFLLADPAKVADLFRLI